MSALAVIHDRLARAIVLFACACAIWGVWAGWRKQAISSQYWGTLVSGELLLVVQGLVGLAMVIAGMQPARTVHGLYDVLTVLAWPAAFAYTRGRDERREMLVYGLVSWLLAALALRAMATA